MSKQASGDVRGVIQKQKPEPYRAPFCAVYESAHNAHCARNVTYSSPSANGRFLVFSMELRDLAFVN